MKILISTLLVLVSHVLKSQPFIPLPNDTATWGIKKFSVSLTATTTTYFTEIQKGDSLINGVKFHKIYKNVVADANLLGLYREVGKKAYCKIVPWPDTNQILLYDFDLNIGDTFFDKYKFLNNDITWKYKLENISTTTLTTNSRKQYDLTLVGGPYFPSPCQNQTWIEGIGSTTTFFNTREQQPDGPCYIKSFGFYSPPQLTCFEQRYTQYMANSCITLGLNNSTVIKESVAILPNPNDGIFKIMIPENISNLKYFIIKDIFGNEVFLQDNRLSGQLEFKINPIQKGIYFLILVVENGKTISQKLIVN